MQLNWVCSGWPRHPRECWHSSSFGFLSQRFSSPFAMKPVRSETHKQNGCQWQPWFYSGLVAHCYVGLSEEPTVVFETRCTRHAEPTNLLETYPRTPVSQNRTRHRRRRSPGMERSRVRDTQAVCGFRYLASNATPFFQTVNVITAIFRARVRRAISGLIPLANRLS
jgi:hypothetical protein